MHFKKQIAWIVTGVTLVGMLTACGSKSDSSATNSSATPSSSTSASTKAATTSSSKGSATTATSTNASTSSKATTATKQLPAPEGPLTSSLSSVLKVDSKTMQKDIQSGKSLADIAKTQGVNEQQVIDVFKNNLKQTLDQNVKSGKMTQAEENQALDNAQNTFKIMVEQKSGK